ncbi:MAG: phosphatase PAP2 family protein [Bacteroidota bacterium]
MRVLYKSLLFLMSFAAFATGLVNQSLAGDKFKDLSAGRIIGLSVRTWPSDFVGIAKSPFNDKKKTTMVLGTTLGLISVDKPTQRFVQNTFSPLFDWGIPPVPGIGEIQVGTRALLGGSTNGYILLGLTGYYLGSLAFKHKEGQVGVILTYKAIATSYLISHLILKTVFARKRPFNPLDGPYPPDGLPPKFTTNNWDFGNFSWPSLGSSREGSSFPSFHFTMYFAMARVLHRTWDNPWVAYGILLAGLLPDFDLHNHWVSDMFIRGVIGTVIGEVIYKNFVNKALGDDPTGMSYRKGDRLKKVIQTATFNPMIGNGYTGVSVRLSL